MELELSHLLFYSSIHLTGKRFAFMKQIPYRAMYEQRRFALYCRGSHNIAMSIGKTLSPIISRYKRAIDAGISRAGVRGTETNSTNND